MEKVKINIVPKGLKPACYVSQNDNGRVVRFELFDELTPYTLDGSETITITVVRPDEVELVSSVVNTEDSYIDVVFNDDMTAIAGIADCELTITDGETVLGSRNFDMNIEIDAYNENVVIRTVSGEIASFFTNIEDNFISLKTNVKASQASGTPTPDNPLPISGYTEANITACGVNLWDEEWEVGNIDGTGANSPASDRIRSKGYIQVKGTTSVYLVIPTAVVIHKYGVDKSYLGNNYVASSGSFTIASDVAFIRFRADTSYGTTYNNDISINYPSTDTTYHAYNGDTVTIAFGQTVYGGTLDVTNGTLEITTARLNLSDLDYLYNTTAGVAPYFYASISGVKYEGPFFSTVYNSKCNIYTCTKRDESVFVDKTYCLDGSAPTVSQIQIKDLDYTDPVLFKASLSGAYIIYELATPVTLTLTSEQINAIVGENNVFSDTNGETEVKYFYKEP